MHHLSCSPVETMKRMCNFLHSRHPVSSPCGIYGVYEFQSRAFKMDCSNSGRDLLILSYKEAMNPLTGNKVLPLAITAFLGYRIVQCPCDNLMKCTKVSSL